MSDHDRAQSALNTEHLSSGDLSPNDLSAKDLPAETGDPSQAKASQGKRCAHCGGPFGLVRRRRAGMQFCSAACMEGQSIAISRAVRDKIRWYAFLRHHNG